MIPLAKNNQKSSELFEYRKYYRDLFYPKDNTNIIDFWNNSLLYGKINKDLDPIVITSSNLKVLKQNTITTNQNQYLVNFAADSFQELLLEFQRADQQSVIKKSKLNPLKVQKGALIPEQEYKVRVRNVLDALLKNDLNEFENKLITFSDYINLFCSRMDIAKPIISQTGYINSKLSSPLITGLMFELSLHDHGTDQKKDKDYLQDPNYKFLINTAEKYSFFVDKNAPWRLVYNLSTQHAASKFSKYNCLDINEVHSKIYSPTYLTDWSYLKSVLIQHYNEQALKKKKVQVPSYCEENEVILMDTIYKEKAEQNQFQDIFWIKLYYYIRLKEEKISITQAQFNTKLNHLDRVYIISGAEMCLKLINQETKQFLDGGTNPSYSQHVVVEKNKLKNNSSFIFKV